MPVRSSVRQTRLLVVLTALSGSLGACAAPNEARVPPYVQGSVAGTDVALGDVVVVQRGVTERGEAAPTPSADRQLVRNAALTLEVPSEDAVQQAMDRARGIVTSLDGYVAAEAPNELTLRVPNERLDEALDRLGALGEVERREVRAVDVTAEYTDLRVLLTNAQALQTRLRALLEDADTVQDVLAVERELARVTAEVERLEGRLRLLENQIDFSSVRLVVREEDRVRPGPVGWVFYGVYEAVKWLLVWD